MSHRPLPPLNALRAFEAAARHASFTRAAAELFVTQGAISRQVKALEDELGQPLFRRLARGLELTAAGRTLLEATDAAFDALAAAVARLKAPPPYLALKVMPTFGVRWLIPRLARLQIEQPDLSVRVTTVWHGAGDESGRDAYDASVGFGQGDWPGCGADLLLLEHLVPVCAPALLKGRKPLRAPVDLARQTLLHPSVDHADWRRWLGGVGVAGVDPDQGQNFDTMETTLAAAAAGYGIAIGAYELIRNELAAGLLVMPFGPMLVESGGYYLIYPPERLADPRFVRFRDWLLAEAVAQAAAARPA